MKFDVIIVDSLSHAWAGEGGALEQVDRLKGGNAFTNGWGVVTPLQNKLNNALTQCSAHLITTLQQHQEYVLEEQTNRHGKTVQVPVRKGLAAVQRKGMEYLFSIYAEIDLDDHGLRVTKSRLDPIKNGKYSVNSLQEFACAVRDFHESGDAPKAPESRQEADRQSEPPPSPPQRQQAPRAPQAVPAPAERYETYWRLFKNSSQIGKPLAKVPTDKLSEYIDRLKNALQHEKYKDDAEKYLAAAQREDDKRREAFEQEAAERALSGSQEPGVDPTTGEVTNGPADDFRGQTASVG
jgi:hypothetical protein